MMLLGLFIFIFQFKPQPAKRDRQHNKPKPHLPTAVKNCDWSINTVLRPDFGGEEGGRVRGRERERGPTALHVLEVGDLMARKDIGMGVSNGYLGLGLDMLVWYGMVWYGSIVWH